MKELSSLVDIKCGSPAINGAVFPDIRETDEGDSPYWTTSPVGVAKLFYYIDFVDGSTDGHSRGFSLRARLVRDRL